MKRRILCGTLATLILTSMMPMQAIATEMTSTQHITVPTDAYYAEAAQALAALNILKGYPDGTFGGEKSITRAEMAAVICRELGAEEAALAMTGTTTYNDVPAGHWASGYVNYVSQNGIVNGIGHGNFAPSSPVKYEEMIKMVVGAMGYGALSESQGGWPYGYIAVATDLGYLTDVQGAMGVASTRGDVAQITCNGLRNEIGAVTAELHDGDSTADGYLELSSELEDATIYYTLDDTTPDADSSTYDSQIAMDAGDYTVQAVATMDGIIWSTDILSTEIEVDAEKITPKQVTSGRREDDTYNIVVSDSIENGSITVESYTAEEGDALTVRATPDTDYHFVEWRATSGQFDDEKKETTTFTMPDCDVEIGAIFAADVTGGYTVKFDLNYEGAEKTIASQIVNNGTGIADFEQPTREGYTLLGWSASQNAKNGDLFDAIKPIESDITLYAQWIGTTDTDGDGLFDDLEFFFATDKTKADTDNDGLNDYLEIALLQYDALKQDSNGDGTPDGEEDFDCDIIDNVTEVTNGTDPALADTDMDGLRDNEEATYKTDALDVDTDNDGASDGDEVALGTNPTVANDSFDVKKTVTTKDGNEVSVQLELEGDQVASLTVAPISNKTLFPEDMHGYMGQAYDFSVTGEIKNATLSFSYDSNKFDANANPTIYYFNESTQELEALETTVNNGVATATTTHFSTYILIDREIYEEAFVWEDIWDTDFAYEGVELALVIDDSGSMDGNDPRNQRLAVAQNLIDNLPENSKTAVVAFDYGIQVLTDMTDDKEIAKSYLTTNYFTSNGGTYMYTGIESAMDLYETTDNNTLKMMVVLSDGETQDASKYANVVTYATDNDIKIYTVGLGSFESNLESLSNTTSGKFYEASNADDLTAIYEDIGEKIDIETDSDGDGISDYYEEHMVSFNGKCIDSDPHKKDTDGDGLLDGEEVQLDIKYNANKTKMIVTGKMMSDPSRADSDGDGYPDDVTGSETASSQYSKDKHSMIWDISHRDLVMCSSMSYSFIPNYVNLDTLSSSLDNELNNRFEGIAKVDELQGWSVVGTWYGGGGLQAVAFRKENNIVMAYRGTDEFVDWCNDATTYVLGLSSHTPAAKKFIIKMMNTYPSCNFYVTGHSLGGHLAYNAAAQGISEKKDAIKEIVTFNGLGLCLGLTLFGDVWDKLQLCKKESAITNYSIVGDPVSKGFLGFTTFHCGTTHVYELSDAQHDPHNLYNFMNNSNFKLFERPE